MPLNIAVDSNEFGVVLRLSGQIDGETSGELERECTAWIARGAKTMLLDFEAVLRISSAGLYSVLLAGKQLNAEAGRLFLSGLHGTVKDFFSLAGLDALFQVFPTADDALSHVRANPA